MDGWQWIHNTLFSQLVCELSFAFYNTLINLICTSSFHLLVSVRYETYLVRFEERFLFGVENKLCPFQSINMWRAVGSKRLTIAITSCVVELDTLCVSVRCQGLSQNCSTWCPGNENRLVWHALSSTLIIFLLFHVDRFFLTMLV